MINSQMIEFINTNKMINSQMIEFINTNKNQKMKLDKTYSIRHYMSIRH